MKKRFDFPKNCFIKKDVFGLCKKCYKIKKYTGIEIKQKGTENLRLYVCYDCIMNECHIPEYNKNYNLQFIF